MTMDNISQALETSNAGNVSSLEGISSHLVQHDHRLQGILKAVAEKHEDGLSHLRIVSQELGTIATGNQTNHDLISPQLSRHGAGIQQLLSMSQPNRHMVK